MLAKLQMSVYQVRIMMQICTQKAFHMVEYYLYAHSLNSTTSRAGSKRVHGHKNAVHFATSFNDNSPIWDEFIYTMRIESV